MHWMNILPITICLADCCRKTIMTRYADFRILIVDDNRNNLFALRALIAKHMDVEVL